MKLSPLSNESDFFTDGKTIYYQNYGMKTPKPIPGVDKESFKIESNRFASDKNKIYAISTMREGLQIFKPTDRESIIFINDTKYFADRYNLYYYNLHFIEYCSPEDYNSENKKWLKKNYKIEDAWWNLDSSFFKKNHLVENNIYINKNRIFYFYPEDNGYDVPIHSYGLKHNGNCYIELKDVNVKNFKVLNTFYSKDNESVYFLSRKINADPNTFIVLQHLFAKDISGIWYNGRLCNEIQDSATFKIITEDKGSAVHFTKDKYNVYLSQCSVSKYKGYASLLKKIKNSNPESFKCIDFYWAKDKNNVYWCGKIFKHADASTFEKIADKPLTFYNWAKDKNYVYNGEGRTLKKGLDGNTFKILNKFWAKDDFVVYSIVTDRIQKTIDAKTFSILDKNGKAEDKNYVYEIIDDNIKKQKTPSIKFEKR